MELNTMTSYQGHRSWNAWNVSLWINNDESLYRLAVHCRNVTKTAGAAARLMMRDLEGMKTPDGAKFNLTCVREAISSIEK
jgi:hypothetical protein